MKNLGLRAGDFWGGLAAASLVLPQAMAFGIALWAPYTQDPASAAFSGLLTAAFLSLASGLAMGTRGLVSAPTGPTFVLLSGSMLTLHSVGLAGEKLISATLLIVGLAGLLQVLIGALRLGHLVKFMPYPVVSGFMTGSGILMLLSQGQVVIEASSGMPWSEGAWIPLFSALITLGIMMLLPRWLPRIPSTIIGLVVGTGAFYLFCLLFGTAIPPTWVVGQVPKASLMLPGLPQIDGLERAHWILIGGSALALAVLASLDTLLTSVVADIATGSRHRSRRELIGQGVGHLLASWFGGMAGAGTTAATLAAIEGGAGRFSGALAGLAFVALIFFLGPIAAILPISVFAGIIMHIAIFSLLDRDIPRWLRTPRARVDGVIALVVTGVTVYFDLVMAVGVGVALAVAEFIRTQVQATVVHRRWNAAERTSFRRRPEHHCALLAQNPDLIVGYELKGVLFFGTADHLLEMVSEDLKRARFLILDMRRVTQVDLTAVRLIEYMSGMMREHGGELILAHVPKSMGLVKRKGHRHERVIPYHANVRLRTFHGSDQALEYAEDAVLASFGESTAQDQKVELRDAELLEGFSQRQCALIEPFFHNLTLVSGEYLFEAGDQGDELYVILRGEIEIFLPVGGRKKLRLGKFGPGMTVGELAFLEPGARTADALATQDTELAGLKHEALRRLCRKHPQLGMSLLMHLAHDMGQNMRRADAELRRLAS